MNTYKSKKKKIAHFFYANPLHFPEEQEADLI